MRRTILLPSFFAPAWAKNLLITHLYAADPSARVFNDTRHTADPVTSGISAGSEGFKCIPWQCSVCVDSLLYTNGGSNRNVILSREGVRPIR
ncbi:MAG: hypothetical protein ONB12_05980 [candidate division KSB1 bacterium]|nr:hypothetical protein [candidate division KSB1 bacterium]